MRHIAASATFVAQTRRYSWMTPGNVEDEEKYELSKYLSEKFICQQIVLDVVGEHWFVVYKKVIKFLRSHVYTWETLYLHYMRNDVMHFDVSHSSAHEGTNHGLTWRNPVRVASPHRINLEEPISSGSASTTGLYRSSVSQSVSPSFCEG